MNPGGFNVDLLGHTKRTAGYIYPAWYRESAPKVHPVTRTSLASRSAAERRDKYTRRLARSLGRATRSLKCGSEGRSINTELTDMSDRKAQPFDIVQKPKHYNNHPSGVEAIELCEVMTFNLSTRSSTCTAAVTKVTPCKT